MQKLIEKGIIQVQDIDEQEIPWVSHIVILISTLLGGFGIIAVLSIMRIINKDTLWLFGVIALGIALFMHKSAKQSIENYYASLILLIAGEVALIVGLRMVNFWDTTAVLWIVAILQIPLFFIIDDYLQRIINITLLTLSITFLNDNHVVNYFFIFCFTLIYSAVFIYMVFHQKRFFDASWFYQIRDALVVNIFILIFLPFAFHNFEPELMGIQITFTFFASILALVTLHRLLAIYKIGNAIAIYGVAIVLLITFYPTPGLIITFILLALGSYQKDYLMMIASLLASVIFMGYWYYSLEFSLLYKSISMIAIGLLMLSLYYLRSRHA